MKRLGGGRERRLNERAQAKDLRLQEIRTIMGAQSEYHAVLSAFASAGIDHLVAVPASGLDPLLDHFERQGSCIYATREEEAVAVAAGLALGGARPIVVMAQAGVGNALNAIFTLADAYSIRFPVMVCFRGEKDPNPVQRVSFNQTKLVLESLGCIDITWNKADAGDEFAALMNRNVRWISCSL